MISFIKNILSKKKKSSVYHVWIEEQKRREEQERREAQREVSLKELAKRVNRIKKGDCIYAGVDSVKALLKNNEYGLSPKFVINEKDGVKCLKYIDIVDCFSTFIVKELFMTRGSLDSIEFWENYIILYINGLQHNINTFNKQNYDFLVYELSLINNIEYK